MNTSPCRPRCSLLDLVEICHSPSAHVPPALKCQVCVPAHVCGPLQGVHQVCHYGCWSLACYSLHCTQTGWRSEGKPTAADGYRTQGMHTALCSRQYIVNACSTCTHHSLSSCQQKMLLSWQHAAVTGQPITTTMLRRKQGSPNPHALLPHNAATPKHHCRRLATAH